MAQVTEQNVLAALCNVVDPDLHKDIVTLGFVKDLKIDGGDVSFRIVLTTPACPVKEQMQAQAQDLVRALPGVASVYVKMDAEVPKGRGITDKGVVPGDGPMVVGGPGLHSLGRQ